MQFQHGVLGDMGEELVFGHDSVGRVHIEALNKSVSL